MQKKTIDVSIPHRLSRDEARDRIRAGITSLRAQHAGKFAQVQDQWRDYHMDFNVSAMGQTVDGWVDVEPDAVKLSVNLPWILAVFAEKLRGQIQQQGQKLLEKK